MATEVGKAYVQIVPSAKGISGAISSQLRGESEKAGTSAGLGIAGKIKGVLVGAGIGKAIASSLSAGSDLQQSLGGVETLFKENADIVKKHAQEAYRTAGLSANGYMEQVTSFSASLLQSLGGDTKKAAQAADMAMVDMSDNANKFGTDIGSIQNAYQGFAKQNYTMLDNLKLGYGGTKEEMQRLLQDAGKLSGQKYDMSNLNDVYQAIHVIQQDLGVTGTTAKEASVTFAGSFAAMKASATNLLGALTTNGDVSGSIKALVQTGITFVAGNLIPMMGSLISAIPTAISTVVSMAVPAIQANANTVTGNIVEFLASGLPKMVSSGADMISNFATGLLISKPAVITGIGTILSRIISAILQALPSILSSGVKIIASLARGLLNNLPAIVSAIANVIAKLISTIISNLPKILQTGITLIAKMAAGMISAIPKILATIPKIFSGLKNAVTSIGWGALGRDIIDGIKQGLLNAASSLYNAVRGVISNALKSGQKKAETGSPAKLFDRELGKWMGLGVAQGVRGQAKAVQEAMDEATLGGLRKRGKMFSVSLSQGQNTSTSTNGLLSQMVDLLQTVADKKEQQVVLDTGKVVGALVAPMDRALGIRARRV